MSGELSHQSAPLFDEVLLVVQYNCGPANLLSDPQPQPVIASDGLLQPHASCGNIRCCTYLQPPRQIFGGRTDNYGYINVRTIDVHIPKMTAVT